MNYIQAQQHKKAVFNGLVDIAAQQQLLERSDFLQQEVIDAAFFAANDMFHLGPTRCEAFGRLILEYLHEIAVLVNSAAEDDLDISYAKGKIDQRMKQICGDNFDPWEVRYGKQMPNHGAEERESDGTNDI